MKKWGFLFALFLVFIFTVLPISQDKIEDQIYEQNDNTAPGNLLLVNSDYTVQQAGIKSDIINLFIHKELTTGCNYLIVK